MIRINGKRKLLVITTVLIVFPLISFGLFAYKYHAIAMEGWDLFNYRCNEVNPFLIKVRNTHLFLGAAMSGEATPSSQEFEKLLNSLPNQADEYLIQEKIWLDKQGSLLNRWDFKMIEPEYVQKAGKYQLAMYQGYYDYYRVVRDFFKAAYKAKETNTKSDFVEDPIYLMDKYQKERIDNQKLYFESFDQGQQVVDWRKYFGQVPEPKCDSENLIIPE